MTMNTVVELLGICYMCVLQIEHKLYKKNFLTQICLSEFSLMLILQSEFSPNKNVWRFHCIFFCILSSITLNFQELYSYNAIGHRRKGVCAYFGCTLFLFILKDEQFSSKHMELIGKQICSALMECFVASLKAVSTFFGISRKNKFRMVLKISLTLRENQVMYSLLKCVFNFAIIYKVLE